MSEQHSNVYSAIAAVMGELSQIGVGKTQKNEQQRYMFRGIDAMYNALSPLMSKHRLLALPRVVSKDTVERQTKKGSTLFFTFVRVEYDFVCADQPDSKHTVTVEGEGMDSGDKSTNKAMSAAYKYAVMQTFCIPVEGQSIDSEQETFSDVVPEGEAVYTASGTYMGKSTGKARQGALRGHAGITVPDLVKEDAYCHGYASSIRASISSEAWGDVKQLYQGIEPDKLDNVWALFTDAEKKQIEGALE